ncbi:hypothetical protein ABLN97_14005 [Mycobacterium tuberculosis]
MCIRLCLDAVLHGRIAGDPDELALPFAWQGVSLQATGPRRCGPGSRAGGAVGGVGGVGGRAGSAGIVGGLDGGPPGDRAAAAGGGVSSGPDRLFEVIWSPASAATSRAYPAYQIFESVAADQDPAAGSYVRSHQPGRSAVG